MQSKKKAKQGETEKNKKGFRRFTQVYLSDGQSSRISIQEHG